MRPDRSTARSSATATWRANVGQLIANISVGGRHLPVNDYVERLIPGPPRTVPRHRAVGEHAGHGRLPRAASVDPRVMELAPSIVTQIHWIGSPPEVIVEMSSVPLVKGSTSTLEWR